MNSLRTCSLLLGVLLAAHYSAAQSTGIWRAWSAWTGCSETCGAGVQNRERQCLMPNPGDTCDGDNKEYRICNSQECPVNGTWTEWTDWTTCSRSCGGGIHERSRECVGQRAGGDPCMGDNREEESCNIFPCPVDGAWGNWAPYSACSVTCGGGFRSRDRNCDSPSPAYGGQSCVGESVEHGECGIQDCPGNEVVHGNWGPWTLFSACNTSCSEGTKTRSRSCTNPLPANNGDTCPGSETEEMSCNLGNCPIDGNWTMWSSFSACSVTCGGGIRYRVRTCADPPPQYNGNLCDTSSLPANVSDVMGLEGLEQRLSEDCNMDACQPVNGSWSDWVDVFSCSVTCGSGVQQRTRSCNSPLPQNGGDDCEVTEPANSTIGGVLVEHKAFICTPGPQCPVHGEWQTWSAWSACPVTCGTGTRQRDRTCTEPAHRGLACEGVSTERQDCLMGVCDIDGAWSSWAPWADCSANCGGGNQTRMRTCTDPPPSGTGANCTGLGPGEEVQPCNPQVCPAVDGGWSSWESWGQCSTSCGGAGKRARLRHCNDPSPARGGATCSGNKMDVEPCHNGPCKDMGTAGNWGQWSAWFPCSKTCGTGESMRKRLCDNPAPSPMGLSCVCEPIAKSGPLWYPDVHCAEESETRICNTHICSVDGQWGPWSPWSECSASCGGGTMRRYKRCDNPAPQNGGLPCAHSTKWINSTRELKPCNQHICVKAMTTIPPHTTTVVRRFCPEVNAYDGLKWPKTEVGIEVPLDCIAPSVGVAYRRCIAENLWGAVNTASCKTADHKNLQNVVYYAAKNPDNTTAVKEAVDLTAATCTKDSITLTGQLLECVRAMKSLAARRIPGDPLLSQTDTKNLYYKLQKIVNELMDPKLKELWDSITINELSSFICTQCELAKAMLDIVTDMGVYLQLIRGSAFCTSTEHLDCCTEPVTCDSVGYRYPAKPPEPTPPNRHIRGGYVPQIVEVSHVSYPDSYYKAPSCYTKRKKRQISASDLLANLLQNTTIPLEKMVPRYPATVVFSSLQELLPDMDKQPYVAPKQDPEAPYIPVEDMHVVNAKVISSTIVGETGLLNQSVHFSIQFFHTKEGREPICAALDTDNRKILYDTSACNLTFNAVNYSVCECSPKEGTFVLLMKPGIIRANFTYVVIDDVFLKYGCYIGVAIHLLAILILLFIGLWDVDRHWIVINFCLSTVIYQLFVVLGMRWVNYDHTCYFMSWLVHYATTVNISWVLGLGGLCFRQIHNTIPLRTRHRLFYAAICWLIPAFIAIIPTGLRYGYVIRKYFCWLSPDEYTNLAFFIPLIVIALVALVFLLVTYNMNSPMLKVRLDGEVPDYATRKRYLRALMVFLLIVSLNLTMIGLNVGVAFLITNIAQCLFVALIFILLNEDVQSGYGNKKDSLEEYIRLKKEQQGEGPDLQAGRHDGDPEWVQQTRTAPMVTIDLMPQQSANRGPISEAEEARAARREKRRRKKLEASKPVYVPPTRQQQLLLPKARPAPARAAAYAPAASPAVHEQTEMMEVEVKPPLKRSRTRQRTRNMTSD